jgi:hypothetical protein
LSWFVRTALGSFGLISFGLWAGCAYESRMPGRLLKIVLDLSTVLYPVVFTDAFDFVLVSPPPEVSGAGSGLSCSLGKLFGFGPIPARIWGVI